MEAATGLLQPSSEYVLISLKYVKEKRDCISEVLVYDHPVKMIICYSVFGNPQRREVFSLLQILLYCFLRDSKNDNFL